jgi:predicted SprT family Zn-dependent metalloprotease
MITVHFPYRPGGSNTYSHKCGCGYNNIYVAHRMQLMKGTQRYCSNCGALFMIKSSEMAVDQSPVERRAQ